MKTFKFFSKLSIQKYKNLSLLITLLNIFYIVSLIFYNKSLSVESKYFFKK